MPEPELVRQPGRCTEDHRSVAGGLQYGTAAQQPGVSNPDGVRGGNRRGKRLWKRRCVEKYKPLFHSAWKTRKPGGIPTFPQARRRRSHPPRSRADSEPSPRVLTYDWTKNGGQVTADLAYLSFGNTQSPSFQNLVMGYATASKYIGLDVHQATLSAAS